MSYVETQVGWVRALHRYPVKATAGESLGVATVTEQDLQHDRRWAAYCDDGGIASGKRTRRFRPVIGLMRWSSRMNPEHDVPTLISPAGAEYRVDDPAGSDALTAAFGQRLRLLPQRATQHHDESPLHLLTTSSISAVAALVGTQVDHRRFRANLIIDTGVEPRYVEDDWTDAELAIGTDVVLHLGPGMSRCVMVDQPQHGVTINRKILKSLGPHNAAALGLQAEISRLGTVRVGDVVTLRRARSR